MPYTVEHAYRYALLTFRDPCSPADWLAALEDVLPRATAALKVLIDLRDAHDFASFSPDAMAGYLELRAKRLEQGRAAMVVSSEPQLEWARRLDHRTQSRGVCLEICGFRDRAAALRWLEDTSCFRDKP